MELNPTIGFNFTSGAALDPRITFTRSSSATYFDALGVMQTAASNVPRFDYNPITLESLGLLIEEQRTNTLLYSEQFNNSAWSKLRCSATANNTNAPDGTLTAEKITQTAGQTNAGIVRQSTGTTVDGTTYTISIFAKAGTDRNFLFVEDVFTSSGARRTWFNISDGTVGTTNAAHDASIQSVGDGWYRCVITATRGATSSELVAFAPADTNGSTTVANNQGFIYLWGAQLEVGANVSSYIQTVASATTRQADDALITGSNFSSFWNPSRGGALVLARQNFVAGTHPLMQFDDSTADNVIALRTVDADPFLYIQDSGVNQANIDAGVIAANIEYELIGWWQTDNCQVKLNNDAVITDTSATIPTVTQARLGSDGTNYLNGHLATVNYYNSFFGRSIYTRRKNKVFVFASLL